MAEPIDMDKLLAFASACERLATAAFATAQREHDAGRIDSSAFNIAYGDYTNAMQGARDIAYRASHQLAQLLAAGPDLSSLVGETANLDAKLQKIQAWERDLSISLKVLTGVASVAAAAIDPAQMSPTAALKTIAGLVGSLA